MLNILAHGTWLGWPGVRVPKLPLAVRGEWGSVKRYFRFGARLEKWGRIKGSCPFSLPLVKSRIPSVAGLSGRSWGSQGTQLAIRASCFEGWGSRTERSECHSRGRATKCLNSSPFWPLLMNYLRVLGFLFLSFFPPLYPSMDGGRVCLVDLDFQSAWPLHVTFSSGSFIV